MPPYVSLEMLGSADPPRAKSWRSSQNLPDNECLRHAPEQPLHSVDVKHPQVTRQPDSTVPYSCHRPDQHQQLSIPSARPLGERADLEAGPARQLVRYRGMHGRAQLGLHSRLRTRTPRTPRICTCTITCAAIMCAGDTRETARTGPRDGSV